MIVATAALEVGFNDPNVGATIQHKSPRGFASYLQRKGRAGRTRKMRPISVTVLSDYGRDRLLFQNYEEKLFDPYLEAQTLPIENSYVLKIQAVYSLFDWLAVSLENASNSGRVDIWNVLSHGEQNADNLTQTLIDKVKNIIFGLVRLEAQYIKSLEQYLENSLGVTGNKVEQLMWENPRSLMLEVIPTISRRLFCGWKMAFPLPGLESEPQMYRHPVPEFIPENLFSELSLPEVSITIPAGDINDQIKTVSMPVCKHYENSLPEEFLGDLLIGEVGYHIGLNLTLMKRPKLSPYQNMQQVLIT